MNKTLACIIALMLASTPLLGALKRNSECKTIQVDDTARGAECESCQCENQTGTCQSNGQQISYGGVKQDAMPYTGCSATLPEPSLMCCELLRESKVPCAMNTFFNRVRWGNGLYPGICT